MTGRIHSFLSLGTVDGPGVRAVVFMQGCPLRCICCHNPDTWDATGGKELSVEEIFEKIYRLRSYFGEDGGVTVSGGEPLMQPEFVRELFARCKRAGIGTALDTSGCVCNDEIRSMLEFCDIVLLDYKYTDSDAYIKNVGMRKEKVDGFLEMLEEKQKRVWLRYVVIPGVNDTPKAISKLRSLREAHTCIEKTELLPFRKLCIEKYKSLGIDFPLADTPEASDELILKLTEYL